MKAKKKSKKQIAVERIEKALVDYQAILDKDGTTAHQKGMEWGIVAGMIWMISTIELISSEEEKLLNQRFKEMRATAESEVKQ